MMPQTFAIVVFLPATFAFIFTLKFRYVSRELRVKSSASIMNGGIMARQFEVRRDEYFACIAFENPFAMLFVKVVLFLGATRKKIETNFTFFAVIQSEISPIAVSFVVKDRKSRVLTAMVSIFVLPNGFFAT